ncbi:MAG: DUF433 domain-containing protein [Chloroflexi bacterium]|nr:DUF433 domain-containing protein [Chloroflexota bacterium]
MFAENNRPSFSGVYPVGDAAALIQATTPEITTLSPKFHPLHEITTRHLFRWVKEGLTGRYLLGLRGRDVALTFLDLVSLRMIAVFRSYGLRAMEIRDAHDKLQEYRGWSHPFAMEPIWLSGLDIYVKENNIPLAVTRNWQIAFEFINEFIGPVHHLLFNDDELPTAWEPSPGIVLDPNVSFGEPCLRDTRIATQVLWALHSAGDPPERIAQAYKVPVSQVKSAIAWEDALAA